MRIAEEKTASREVTLAIPERKFPYMYFLWLGGAIAVGVVLAKAVRAYSA